MKKHYDAAVLGNGWSALGAVTLLTHQGKDTLWLSGSRERFLPPLPYLSQGEGVSVLEQLMGLLGVELGPSDEGIFLRDFRNKSFQLPQWLNNADPEARQEVLDELLWGPEKYLVSTPDVRFPTSLIEVDQKWREALEEREGLERLESLTVQALRSGSAGPITLELVNGEEVEVDTLILADRPQAVRRVKGLEKEIRWADKGKLDLTTLDSKWNPCGVVQLTLKTSVPVGAELQQGFSLTPVKDKEEKGDIHRRMWGSFDHDGRSSTWSLFLSHDEAEDNRFITKKIRRMKAALNKTLVGEGWIEQDPEAKKPKEYTDLVTDESVFLSDGMVFGKGEAPDGMMTMGVAGTERRVPYLTDGFGLERALYQLAQCFGLEVKVPEVEAEPEGETETENDAVLSPLDTDHATPPGAT